MKYARLSLTIATAITALFLGAFGGIMLERSWRSTPENSPDVDRISSTWQPDSTMTKQLGQELMARVGQTFVADNREAAELGGVSFYTEPKPYGDRLCRFDEVHVSPWIFRGGAKTEEEYYEDEIEIVHWYAVARVPISKVSDRQGERDCEEYRDFESAFISDVGSQVRAVFLLSEILKGVESGNPQFTITCVDQRSTMPGTPCDGGEVLGSLELRQLNQTENVTDRETPTSSFYTDSLRFTADYDPGDHPETIELSVKSVQTIGQQSADAPTLREVNVSLDAL